jgi:hypothetical protein
LRGKGIRRIRGVEETKQVKGKKARGLSLNPWLLETLKSMPQEVARVLFF